MTKDQQEKWLSVTSINFMSSEESGEDDEIIVHPLPWRADYVNQMFDRIDEFRVSQKSPQARRQMKQRKIGPPSERSQPDGIPEWAVRKNS